MNPIQQVWINGRMVPPESAQVSVFDRSFLYGDGLFETIGVRNGRPAFWNAHWERFTRGADFLGIRIGTGSAELRTAAEGLLAGNGVSRGVLRITLSRGCGTRGYSPRGANEPQLILAAFPDAGLQAAPRRLRLATASFRLGIEDPLTRVKSASKLLNVLARAEAEAAGADEALLLNTAGRMAEAGSGNLFWISGDRIWTPSLQEGALPGIARGILQEIAPSLGLRPEETAAFPEALVTAESVGISSSAQGLAEVVSLDGRPLGTSPVTERLWAEFQRRMESDTLQTR
jgi:branched-chain amino acid aminotransferase